MSQLIKNGEATRQHPRANFDDRPYGGRDRFHDRTTLERLQAVKSRVDPTGVFTCATPLLAQPRPKSLVSCHAGGSH